MEEINCNTTAGMLVCGCDEAGRGPLAGPVFAGAVILPQGFSHPLVRDSKKLSEKQRLQAREIILENALAWGVASCSPAEIDKLNILWASVEAMKRAVASLALVPDLLLIDGNRFSGYLTADGKELPHRTIVHGDAIEPAISAASILAKTSRDEYMKELAKKYPQYGWDHNMAYPTAEHREAIARYGITEHHRKSFIHPVEAELF